MRLKSIAQSLRPQRAGVVYALVILVMALVVATSVRHQPGYLSVVNISNILGQAAPDAILAVFMTVVLISGNFDLSVASVAALSGALALKTIDAIGTAPAVGIALGVGIAVGLANAVLVQKVGINAFIVTLGSMTAIRGLVLIALNGESVTAQSQSLTTLDNTILKVPVAVALVIGLGLAAAAVVRFRKASSSESPPLDGYFVALVAGALICLIVPIAVPAMLRQSLPVWLMIWIGVAVSVGLRFLVVGRNLYAVGSNAEAARLSGISVSWYKMAPFVMSAVAAAGVGLVYAGRFNSLDPNALTGEELTVIAAAILGGTSLFGGSGFVGKSVLGTVILFTLSNGFNVLNLGSNYQYVVQGAVLIAASAVYMVAAKSPSRKGAAPSPSSTVAVDQAVEQRESVDVHG
ncbi:MAG: D-xylose transport system permease protein [Acidimicrobiaceae bacterium]|nr:D-xylose transport system permease protein [Acidimicrobiaceae bacterium]